MKTRGPGQGKVVLFGAGATGRGHVGLLAWQAGLDLVLVDKKRDLIDSLNRSGRYTVTVHGETRQSIEVTGFRAFHAADRERVAREIVDASLVLTAVFDRNLPDVAITISQAVKESRKAARAEPLNCVACENMVNSSSTLGRHVRELLEREDRAFCEERFGFPDCMISRVVPQPEDDPLVLVTEDYNEWTVRSEAFLGEKPPTLIAMELVDNQTARLERKLLIHNGGHAVCGYLAFHRGHRFIHEAVADPFIAETVGQALDEIGEVVRRKHGFSQSSIGEYKADLVRRGSIAAIRDQVLRVVRDPIRKLSPRERLVAPALYAAQHGLSREGILKGIVAALEYRHPKDNQSCMIGQQLENEGLCAVLRDVCGIDENSPLVDEIERLWYHWNPRAG